MPLPSNDYGGWKWGHASLGFTQRTDVAGKAGWVQVPGNLAQTDSDSLIVDAGAVRLKTQGELDADAAAADAAAKVSAFETALDAQKELDAATNLRAALVAAGKSTTRCDSKISGATTKRANAIASLP